MNDDKDKIIVIKYGGSALDDWRLRASFLKDLKSLHAHGFKFVITHGGGPRISQMLKKLAIESKFENGLRVTDAPTLEVVEMILCGQVNKELCRILLAEDLPAVGLSGEDDNMLVCEPISPALGFVGKIVKVNPELPLCLLENGYIPVIAPLALDASLRPYNVNADTAAGALAGALKAEAFILISDVPGVLDANGSLFSYLSEKAIQELVNAKTISGGMMPKVEACLTAIKNGCQKAFILDGREEGALSNYLKNGALAGTEINI